MAHRRHAVLAPVSQGYPPPNDKSLRVTHPSATNGRNRPCDLHVLSMPPAFALSQDQTLRFIHKPPITERPTSEQIPTKHQTPTTNVSTKTSAITDKTPPTHPLHITRCNCQMNNPTQKQPGKPAHKPQAKPNRLRLRTPALEARRGKELTGAADLLSSQSAAPVKGYLCPATLSVKHPPSSFRL